MPRKKFHDVFIVVDINKPTNIVDIPAPLQQQHYKEIDGSLQDRDSLLCRIQHPIWSPKLLLRSFTMQPPEDVSAPPEIEPSSIQVLWWPQTMSSNFGIAPENFSDLFLKNFASYPNQILLVMGILGCCSRVQSAARSTWPMQTPRPWSWSKRSRVTHTRWIVSLGTKNTTIELTCDVSEPLMTKRNVKTHCPADECQTWNLSVLGEERRSWRCVKHSAWSACSLS